MHSSNNHIKYFFFIALAAGIGMGFSALIFKGGEVSAQYLADLVNPESANQAAVIESIPQTNPETEIPITIEILPSPSEVTLNFVGDIMLDRSVKKSVENNFGGDYSKLFENVSDLSRADILFGNLEGPVSSGGKKSGSVYSFRFSSDSLSAVASAGFDVLSIANNHIGDWGAVAFADTLDAIASNGMSYAGGGWNKEETETPVIIEKNGIKIGFLGFTDVGPDWMEAGENTPGIILASDPNFAQIIENAANKVDVLVVSFHWGVEYKKQTGRQAELAHKAIDNGAKIVVGHHPHVSQDTEEYNDGLIAYSLGNFIFDQKFSEETMTGMLLEAIVTKEGLKDFSTKTIRLNDKFQPQTPVE